MKLSTLSLSCILLALPFAACDVDDESMDAAWPDAEEVEHSQADEDVVDDLTDASADRVAVAQAFVAAARAHCDLPELEDYADFENEVSEECLTREEFQLAVRDALPQQSFPGASSSLVAKNDPATCGWWPSCSNCPGGLCGTTYQVASTTDHCSSGVKVTCQVKNKTISEPFCSGSDPAQCVSCWFSGVCWG